MTAAVRIEHGDCREVLRVLAAEGVMVDSVVTDPPYHLTSIVKRFGKPGSAPVKVKKLDGQGGSPFARGARGFMGKVWDGGDIAYQPETWALVFALMKPGAHLLAFGGTRGHHRMFCAIEDAGFEIRDSIADAIASDTHVGLFLASLNDEQRGAFFRCIDESVFGGLLAWVFGSGFPKSHDVAKGIDKAAGKTGTYGDKKANVHSRGDHQLNEGWKRPWMDDAESVDRSGREYEPADEAARQWAGWGSALKPAWEPIVLARKPLVGTIAANVLQHGTGALNVDACRIEGYTRDPKFIDDRGNGQTWVDGSTGLRKAYMNRGAEGRWPANVVHDGSDEVIAAFPTSESPEPRKTKRSPDTDTRNGYGAFKGQPDVVIGHGDSGSAARFFYSAKADATDRLGSKHPTVKPVDLMRWLVRLVTPKGGLVLDPFAGTGTTGMACMAEGMRAILIEREAEYVADIRKRIAHVSGQDAPLFGGSAA